MGAKLAGCFALAGVQPALLFDPDRPPLIHHERVTGDALETRVGIGPRIILGPPGLEVDLAGHFREGGPVDRSLTTELYADLQLADGVSHMRILRLLPVLITLAALPTAANAGVPIPCTGESLVKVVDVPAMAGVTIKANQDLKEKRLDIGYKFIGCFGGGEWVGYLGHSTRYLPLDAQQFQTLVTAAGLGAPPPVPSRLFYWETMKVPLLWLGILGFALVYTAFDKRNKEASGREHAHEPGPTASTPPLAAGHASRAQVARRVSAVQPATARTSFGRRG